ncbi:hypothetical protein KI659_11270 [Litoribacter alkaliphilus]|uniref:Lipoprotein n=1 Tax=Litoribacter ruber TaxID=702568 RepID=A0AAP2CIQ3_9BACT|nr:hypothetical protein [Litoribacter alkaliphilus]MBS9524590.1 hypothetical protein [Litoribacter alkaliphilus]
MKASYIVLLFVVFFSCQESEDLILDKGYDYQPLQEGFRWTYQLSETICFGENDCESANFFIRDSVAQRYKAENNLDVFVIVRRKSPDRRDWKFDSQYTMHIEEGKLLRRKDNEFIVPLIFPPNENRQWNGNLYNVASREIFKISREKNYKVGQLNFSEVLKVLHEEFDDLITLRDVRHEIFAKGIGLVESYYERFNYCSRNDCLGEQRIESGRLTHIKLLSYDQ